MHAHTYICIQYINAYMYTYIQSYILTYFGITIHICIHTYIHTMSYIVYSHTYRCICMYACICMYGYVCMYMYACICMYVYVCVYVRVYIRVFPSKMKMFQVVSFNSSNPPFGATFYNDYAHQISFDLNNI